MMWRVSAPPESDAEVIVTTPAEALKHAEQAEVILGPVPRQLFQAPRLRWVQATSSGVDPYMYPELRDSDVILTSEKGLVGEHLADHAFGLLLLLTRQLPRTLRMGPDSWNHRPALRHQMIRAKRADYGDHRLWRHGPRRGATGTRLWDALPGA